MIAAVENTELRKAMGEDYLERQSEISSLEKDFSKWTQVPNSWPDVIGISKSRKRQEIKRRENIVNGMISDQEINQNSSCSDELKDYLREFEKERIIADSIKKLSTDRLWQVGGRINITRIHPEDPSVKTAIGEDSQGLYAKEMQTKDGVVITRMEARIKSFGTLLIINDDVLRINATNLPKATATAIKMAAEFVIGK